MKNGHSPFITVSRLTHSYERCENAGNPEQRKNNILMGATYWIKTDRVFAIPK